MNQENTTILLPCSMAEFTGLIRTILRSELQKQTGKSPVEYSTPGMLQKPLFKAAEVCEMLSISRVTLHAWVKQGLLKKYKIRSRTFFLWNDIEKLINPNQK